MVENGYAAHQSSKIYAWYLTVLSLTFAYTITATERSGTNCAGRVLFRWWIGRVCVEKWSGKEGCCLRGGEKEGVTRKHEFGKGCCLRCPRYKLRRVLGDTCSHTHTSPTGHNYPWKSVQHWCSRPKVCVCTDRSDNLRSLP